ncbi:MAG: hypothetical protein WDN00_10125 [Limisphaerales bacterium]
MISEESYSISEGASLWAVQDGTEYPVPFAIFPIGFDTNTLTIFSATQFEIDELIGDTELETLSEESKEFSFANILGAAGIKSIHFIYWSRRKARDSWNYLSDLRRSNFNN